MNNENEKLKLSPDMAIMGTNLTIPALVGDMYKGKVRDVYNVINKYLVVVATDRLSAFDVVLPKGIPFKGQVLNQMSLDAFDAIKGVVPIWVIESPHPLITIGYRCESFPVEIIVRATNTGSCWRDYKNGKTTKSGVPLPLGMVQDEKFPAPIITPTTKAPQGAHDEDISYEEIIAQGLVSKEDLDQLYDYAKKMFAIGSAAAEKQGLLLADTKYEFGKNAEGNIMVIDEIHTPDSSRYFYWDDYILTVGTGKTRQLSKEFVREWLMQNGFQGKEGQAIPEMSQEFITSITDRYIELYENITGKPFVKTQEQKTKELYAEEMEKAIKNCLTELF